jgi:hypothetical protein
MPCCNECVVSFGGLSRHESRTESVRGGKGELPSCVHLALGSFLEFDVLPAVIKQERFNLDTTFVEGFKTAQHGLLIAYRSWSVADT